MIKRTMLFTWLWCLVAAVAVAAGAPGSAVQPRSGGTTPVSATAPDNVSTAPRAYTVEELYKNMAGLNKKKVMVRGKAVKATSGIMGKNWIHIQDGTGDKTKGTDDLICISATDMAEPGDAVAITGTVTFKPAGRYQVVIEDATISK
jgi:DNA/RNA endonuclease YhcR with UshA esterase domain